jgi:hypothetical protein
VQWVVAVSRLRRDGGAEERRRRDDPEQGRPVLDEAPGIAERTRGEGRQTYDTRDWGIVLKPRRDKQRGRMAQVSGLAQ